MLFGHAPRGGGLFNTMANSRAKLDGGRARLRGVRATVQLGHRTVCIRRRERLLA
jgi:hypothetical protein